MGNLAIAIMQFRVGVIEMTANQLLKNGDESSALIYQLRADKLREEIEIEKINSGPHIPDCPECHHDLGSNQENCKTCFDSDPQNEGHCFSCGERRGTNDDCFDCRDYLRDAEQCYYDMADK